MASEQQHWGMFLNLHYQYLKELPLLLLRSLDILGIHKYGSWNSLCVVYPEPRFHNILLQGTCLISLDSPLPCNVPYNSLQYSPPVSPSTPAHPSWWVHRYSVENETPFSCTDPVWNERDEGFYQRRKHHFLQCSGHHHQQDVQDEYLGISVRWIIVW